MSGNAKLTKVLEILLDKIPLSKTDIIIFVVGATGTGKSTLINTAISENVMTVGHKLHSCANDVESVRCTSPWNPSGRSVIFAEIPPFDHSDETIQKRIPELIKKWLRKTYFIEGPIDSGILYLHSMASPRITEDFKKHLDLFVQLCHECGHKPRSALLVSTLWPHGEKEEEEVCRRTELLEKHFTKTATSVIYLIPYSVRFDEDRSSARKAIDSLMQNMQQNDYRTSDHSLMTCNGYAPRLDLTFSESGLFPSQ